MPKGRALRRVHALLRTAALGALLSAPAAAGEGPRVNVEDDGTIIARMVLDAPADQVKKTIPSLQEAQNSSSVLEMRFTMDGNCRNVDRKTRGLWRPLELRTRFCPTRTGWREHLVESSDFDAYDTEWVVQDQPDGRSLVELRQRADINLSVPSAMIRSGQVSGVRETFQVLMERLFKPKAGGR